MHVWCRTCADGFTEHPHNSPAMHKACADCRIVRSILELSWRWHHFMWEVYRVDMETVETYGSREVLEIFGPIEAVAALVESCYAELKDST